MNEITLKTGRVRVEFIKSWNAGRCYNKMQFAIYSEWPLSTSEVDELADGGHIGYGQELYVGDFVDGKTVITRGIDSSD